MDDPACREFFTQPTHRFHRPYEALRAVFVDGRCQKEVSEAFGFQYDSFRQLICQFRRSVAVERPATESPFFIPSKGTIRL